MTDSIKYKSPENASMPSVEELKSYPGFENKSDDELMELAIFLKEYSLILYNACMKSIGEEK